MKVQELRIGNWLRHKFIDDRHYDTEQHVENDYLCQVVFIGDNQLVESKNGYWHPISEFEPIPLTEHVLLDCLATKKTNDTFQLHHWEVSLNGLIDNGLCLINEGYLVLYLHQLQNIFYYNTGRELTYQPRPI